MWASHPSSLSLPKHRIFRCGIYAPCCSYPVDLRGLPYVAEGRSKWAVPEFLPPEGAGIPFLDELNAARARIQSAFYQLCLTLSAANMCGTTVLETGGGV